MKASLQKITFLYNIHSLFVSSVACPGGVLKKAYVLLSPYFEKQTKNTISCLHNTTIFLFLLGHISARY